MVGRTQKENEALLPLVAPGDLLLQVEDYPGPLVLVSAAASEADVAQAAGLAAAYSDAPTGAQVRVSAPEGAPGQVMHLHTPPKDHFQELLI